LFDISTISEGEVAESDAEWNQSLFDGTQSAFGGYLLGVNLNYLA